MAEADDPWADDISLRQRWRYLPRLIRLFWQVGRWQVVLFVAIIVVHGALPVGSVVILRYLVDVSLAVAQGAEALRLAAIWLAVFLLVEFVRTMVIMAGRNQWLSGDIEERLKAGVQQHLLEKAARLPCLQDESVDLKYREFKQISFSTATSQMTFGLVLTGVVALIARGSLSVGYYAAFLSAAERFRGALSQVLWAFHSIDADLRYIRDLMGYLDLPEERRGFCRR